MILVTGGTGFIGQALIRHLVGQGHPVRTLVRPSSRSPNLPRGVAVEAVVSSLSDMRGLGAAMVGVKTVFHLASGEWRGTSANLFEIDIQGTKSMIEVAQEAGVRRFFYISHLGADRASAYPVLKAKAIAEEFVRRSTLVYTILRTAIVYGPHDGFTTGIARTLRATPFFYMIPGNGNVLLQPLWIEDLVTCMVWAMENSDMVDQTLDIGGPEYLSFNQIVDQVMRVTGMKRRKVPVSPPLMRGFTVLLEAFFPRIPVSVYWLDYLAANRTTSLDTLPRVLNLMPGRFSQNLDYLRGKEWRRPFFSASARSS